MEADNRWTGQVMGIYEGEGAGVRSPAWFIELASKGLLMELRCPNPEIPKPVLWQWVTVEVVRIDVSDSHLIGVLRLWAPIEEMETGE